MSHAFKETSSEVGQTTEKNSDVFHQQKMTATNAVCRRIADGRLLGPQRRKRPTVANVGRVWRGGRRGLEGDDRVRFVAGDTELVSRCHLGVQLVVASGHPSHIARFAVGGSVPPAFVSAAGFGINLFAFFEVREAAEVADVESLVHVVSPKNDVVDSPRWRDTHEPCNPKHIKRSPANIQKEIECFSSAKHGRDNRRVSANRGRPGAWPTDEKTPDRGQRRACVAKRRRGQEVSKL